MKMINGNRLSGLIYLRTISQRTPLKIHALVVTAQNTIPSTYCRPICDQPTQIRPITTLTLKMNSDQPSYKLRKILIVKHIQVIKRIN